jgi:hypothetical protein
MRANAKDGRATMDYNIDENRPIIMKTDNSGSSKFDWFDLIFFKMNSFEKTCDKLEKPSDKSKISVGLSFFIQNLNFK